LFLEIISLAVFGKVKDLPVLQKSPVAGTVADRGTIVPVKPSADIARIDDG
jgi:hypothetical protein